MMFGSNQPRKMLEKGHDMTYTPARHKKNNSATKRSRPSKAMHVLYHFSTAKPFQAHLKGVVEDIQTLKSEQPEMFKDIKITVRRVLVGALNWAHSQNAKTLHAYYNENLMPSVKYKDIKETPNPYQKTIHVSPATNDYILAGQVKMNIDIFGIIEDREHKENPDTKKTYRLTARQYIHLALLGFAEQSSTEQILAIRTSERLYPFLWKGMTKKNTKRRTKAEMEAARLLSKG